MTQLPSRIRLAFSRVRPGPLPLLLLGIALPGASPLSAQTLRGSRASMDVQNRQAEAHDFTFLRTSAQVRQFVSAGYLVAVKANADFDLHAVSYPYARPEAELFIRRLAAQYRAACGEKLVVTSLTRPQNGQPANASSRSVHPTGMAVDLRRSNVGACRSWLEGVLVQLEGAGILEATRERYPPHYHIAIFPRDYVSHVERLAQTQSQAETRTVVAQADAEIVAAPTAAELDALLEYRVRRGDSLWTIARAYGTTVTDLRSTNALRTSRIYAGQVLQVPVARR